MSMDKMRLDELVVLRGLVPTRSRAQAEIMAGHVLVEGEVCSKAGEQVPSDARIELHEPMPWASRGGLKLAPALDALSIDPAGKTCLDLGASHGGFTDVLLVRGASRVAAVDVGHGLLLPRLANDSRVLVLDGRNARHLLLEWFPPEWLPFGLVTADLSFISLCLILPRLPAVLAPGADLLLLVKPQFELGRELIGKGVVRDDALRKRAVDAVAKCGAELGMEEQGRVDSEVAGPKGNREIFLWLRLKVH
jgi:23S rRNA (cytidine1920-2'-O)/16S rRNA (cytidine1409-2'-O)-methyltransferase